MLRGAWCPAEVVLVVDYLVFSIALGIPFWREFLRAILLSGLQANAIFVCHPGSLGMAPRGYIRIFCRTGGVGRRPYLGSKEYPTLATTHLEEWVTRVGIRQVLCNYIISGPD